MAQDNSSNKIKAVYRRRSRTNFTADQVKILIDAFNQKPYPSYATKQKLALEINTEESRIQIWFQNRRARHLLQRTEPEEALESSQDQGQVHPATVQEPPVTTAATSMIWLLQVLCYTTATLVRETRRCRTSYTSSQLCTLIEAFENNPYPGIDSREQLAKEIGVPESRVQIWFQNRRSRFHGQRKRETVEDLEQRQDQEQNL